MTFRIFCLVLAVLIPLPTLAAVSVVMLDKSPQQLIREVPNKAAIRPAELISRQDILQLDLDSKAKPGKRMLLVGGEQSILVSLETASVVALPVRLRSSQPIQKLRIDGYLIKPKSSGQYVMFPIATALASDGTILATLSPLEESRSKGNAIRNFFLVPEGTEYLLLHGLLDMDVPEHGYDAKGSSLGQTLASVGGAVGGLIFGAMQNFQVARGKVQLSNVGVVEIFLEDA